MASYEGDVIYAPGYAKSEVTTPIEILYSTEGLLQKGGTLKPGQGDLPAGTAMKYDSATKRYEKATSAAETTCFLRLGASTGDANALPHQAPLVLGGTLKAQFLNINGTAVDATAAAALATALTGKYNAERNFLKF